MRMIPVFLLVLLCVSLLAGCAASAAPSGPSGASAAPDAADTASPIPAPSPAPEDTAAPSASPEPAAPAEEPESGGPRAAYEARPSTAGALRVEGTRLVGEDGAPVVLRGISTHGIAWFPRFVNAESFASFSDWGANLVRLAMYTEEYGGYCAGGDRDALKDCIRQGVAAAKENDMYAIVDWHILSDGDPTVHAEDAQAFFAEMTAEFGDDPSILYEICNEPNGGVSWETVRAYAQTVIPVIRENAPHAVILCGTPDWCQRIGDAAADPITDFDNILYTLHFYAGTHKDSLRGAMRRAVEGGLPVFVSEYGLCDASGSGALDRGSAQAWVREMDELGISGALWNLSDKDESSAVLVPGCAKDGGFSDDDLSESGKWLKEILAGTFACNYSA